MPTLRMPRRKDRALSEAEALQTLARADHGVLATVDAEGQPYAVPLNHVLAGDVLYLHCAPEGHKLDNIAHQPRASYGVVLAAAVDSAILSTYYESAIVFGRAELVSEQAEKREALELLVTRFCGAVSAENEQYIGKISARTAVIRIQIEEMCGKAHRRERSGEA